MVEVKHITLSVLSANAYVVSEGKDAILIDPGSDAPEDVEAIQKALEGLTLHAILYTHNHYDHIGGGHLFSEPQYMYEEDIKAMSHTSTMARSYFNIDFVQPEKILPLAKEMDFGKIHLKVYLTPGHSPGSVCFLIEENLFTGDTLFKAMHGRTDLGGDMQDMKASLGKLATFADNIRVYPGHGPSTYMGEEKKWMRRISEEGWDGS